MIKFLNRIYNIFIQFLIPLRNKMIVFSIMLIFSVIPLTGYFAYSISTNVLSAMVERMNMYKLSNTCDNINAVLDNARSTADSIVVNKNLIEILNQNISKKSQLEKLGMHNTVKKIFSNIDSPILKRINILLIGENGLFHDESNKSIDSIKNNYSVVYESRPYKILNDNKRDFIFFLSSEYQDDELANQITKKYGKSIVLINLVRGYDKNELGALIIIFDSNYLKNLIGNNDNYYSIFANDYSNEISYISSITNLKNTEILNQSFSYWDNQSSFLKESVKDNLFIFGEKLKYSNLKYIEIVQNNKNILKINMIRNITIIAVLCCISFAIILAILFSKRLTKSYEKLQSMFKRNSVDILDMKEIKTKLKQKKGFTCKLNFNKKLIIFFLLIILGPSIILTAVFYYATSDIILSTNNQLWNDLLYNTVKKIDVNLLIKKNTLDVLFTNQDLQQTIKKINRERDVIVERDKLAHIVYSTNYFMHEIQYVNIYNKDGDIVFSTLGSYQNLYLDYDRKISVKQNSETTEKWIGGYSDMYGNKVFCAVKELKDLGSTVDANFNKLGYALIAFNESLITEIINTYHDDEMRIQILDNNDRVMFSIPQADVLDDEKNVSQYFNKKIYISGPSQYTGWRIMVEVPYKRITKDIHKVLYYNIILIVISFLLLSIISLILSQKFSKPFKYLIDGIREVKNGNFNYLLDLDEYNKYENEFVLIAQSFNKMVIKIRELIKEVYETKIVTQEMQIKWKEAKLKALQAQINPHFLYNTLDTIRCKAMFLTGGNNEVSSMIFSLSNLFRLIIKRESEFVILEEEINHSKYYLDIERYRFNDKINVKWIYNDDVLKLKVIKLILQPIIENAIHHGLEPKKGIGTIYIKIFKEQDKLLICIKDDGIGISKDELEKITQKNINKTQTNIGIENVNQRIKLHYGDEYGLSLYSQVGKGTEVKIILPVNE